MIQASNHLPNGLGFDLPLGQRRTAAPQRTQLAAEARGRQESRQESNDFMLPGYRPAKIIHRWSPYRHVGNRTILDMINFCPPGTPIAARRALKNVLQSRRVYQPGQDRFFVSPGAAVPAADTPEAPGDLLAPEPAVRTGALIGYARVSTTGQLLDRQQVALAGAGCLRVFADKLSGKNTDRPELTACLDYLRPGDTLVVPSLDRLSRSLQDLITLVARLRRRGARPVGLRADTTGRPARRSGPGVTATTSAAAVPAAGNERGHQGQPGCAEVRGSPARPRTGHRMRRRRPGPGACNRPRARAVPLAA